MTVQVVFTSKDLLAISAGVEYLSSSSDGMLAGTLCHMTGPVVVGRKLLEASTALTTCSLSDTGNNMAIVVVSTSKQFLAGFALMKTSLISRVLLQLVTVKVCLQSEGLSTDITQEQRCHCEVGSTAKCSS